MDETVGGPEYIGSIMAQFSVSSDGAAGYSLPIVVPPGIANLQPHMTLAYGAGAGNGLLGIGWSLRGLSVISRSGQTLAQDGTITPVTYGPSDRFTLDGQRLILVAGGGYDASDAVFHTEVESWQKVIPIYDARVPDRRGPDSFIVLGPDGRKFEYGGTPDSKVLVSPRNPSVRLWALNKITDENGNALTIRYDLDAAASMSYPVAIDYTLNEANRATPRRQLRFSYVERPDVITKYRGGYRVVIDRLLSAIETYVDDRKVRRYELGYIVGAATGRSRLISVTESDGDGRRLPATLLDWQDSFSGIFAPTAHNTIADVAPAGVHIPMDVNGDGRTDIVNAYENGGFLQVTLLISNGVRFDDPVTLPPTAIPYGAHTQLIPLDVDGDGRMDLICATQVGDSLRLTLLRFRERSGYWLAEQGPLYQAGPQDLPSGGTLIAMDIDGDGFIDLLYAYGSGSSMKLVPLYSDGQSSFARSPDDCTSCAAPYFDGATWLPLDIDGDGRSDLVYAYQNGANYSFVLFRSEGRTGLRQQDGSPLPSGITVAVDGTLLAVDVNGDGLMDIVHASLDNSGESSRILLQTLLSDGAGFVAAPPQSIALAGLRTGALRLLPGDYNGDGLIDLAVAIGRGHSLNLEVLISSGTGFALAQGITQPDDRLPSSATILPLDYQGTGLTGLLFIYASGRSLALAGMPAAGPYPDLLTRITEGLGGRFDIDYLPLTNPLVYKKFDDNEASGQIDPRGLLSSMISGATATLRAGVASRLGVGTVPASRVLDFPKYVVSRHRKNFVRGDCAPGDFSYSYVSAKLDLRGRGWLGFAKMSVNSVDSGTNTITCYHQDFPLTFATKSSVTRRAVDNALMLDLAYSYRASHASSSSGSGVYIVETVGVTRKFYTFASDVDSVPDAIEERRIDYDEFGNATRIASTGSALAAPLYSFATYDNDPMGWRLGRRVDHRRCADAAGSEIFDWRQFGYFGATGNLSSEDYWNDQTKEMEHLTYTVDGFGNRTSVTNAAGATTRAVIDDDYHCFPITIISPPNAAGAPLSWRRSYDAGFGTVATATDPNGIATTHLVDGLGRATGIDGPMPNGERISLLRQHHGCDSIGPYLETEALIDWAGGTRWKRSYLDGFGRVFKTVSLGPNGKTPVVEDLTLDQQGRAVRRSLPYYDNGARPSFEENRYDAYGRLVSRETPGGEDKVRTTYEWVAIDKVIETRGAGSADQRVITSQYRLVGGHLKCVSRQIGDAPATIFAYDGLGRLTAATDPAGTKTGVAYDSVGRRVSMYRQAKGQSATNIARFNYEVSPGVISMTETDAGGGGTRMNYDLLGRLIERRVTGVGGETGLTTFAYDDPVVPYGNGRITAANSPDTEYRYRYDAAGNTTGLEVVLGSDRFAFEKSFAPGARPQTLTFPDGSVQGAVYNAAGVLSGINFRPQGAATQLLATYDEITSFGRPGRITYSNGVVTRLDYDACGRLHLSTGTGPGGPLYSRRYTWNDYHQLSETIDGGNVSRYGYDSAGRLIEAALPLGTRHFAYDTAGNIVKKDGVIYVNDADRPISGSRDGTEVFAARYDVDGNMVRRTVKGVSTRFRYDAENRLVEAGPITFAYDHSGRRVKKKDAGETTFLYPSRRYEVAQMADGSRRYSVYLDDAFGLAAIWTKTDMGTGRADKGVPQSDLHFINQDHINSIRLQTDDKGAVTTLIDYQPFGEPMTSGKDTIPRKFTGASWDDDLGLYYLGARYYDPETGRFITADMQPGGPLDEPDVLNAYAYCLNDPINRFDTTGHGIDDLFHDFGHEVKHFFTDTVPAAFHNRVVKIVLSSFVDGALIVGGVAALVLSPLAGPFAPLVSTLGATALGAGIGGVAYQITSGGDIDWGEWGIQLGIGGAAGLVAGGAAAGAGVIFDTAGTALTSALRAGTLLRTLLNASVAITANAAGGVLGEVLNNVDPYHPGDYWYQGVGSAALLGSIFGGAGSVAGDIFLAGASRAVAGYWILKAAGLGAAAGVNVVPRFGNAVGEATEALTRSVSFNLFFVLPGLIFVAADDAVSDTWHPSW